MTAWLNLRSLPACAARPLYCPRADVGRPLPEIDYVSASVKLRPQRKFKA